MDSSNLAVCPVRDRSGSAYSRQHTASVNGQPGPISVLIAEGITLMREGLAALCEASAGCTVVAQCEDGVAALHLISTLRPHIAVLDLDLPKLLALEIVRRVRRENLATKIIVLSSRVDRKTVIEALRSGVQAFLPKAGPARHLIEAIQQAVEGGIYVSPLLEAEKIFGLNSQRLPKDPLETLSAREYQVFSLLVDGLRAKEIAGRLELSAKTIDTHRANLMRKLDIHDVAGLVKFAIQRKLTAIR